MLRFLYSFVKILFIIFHFHFLLLRLQPIYTINSLIEYPFSFRRFIRLHFIPFYFYALRRRRFPTEVVFFQANRVFLCCALFCLFVAVFYSRWILFLYSLFVLFSSIRHCGQNSCHFLLQTIFLPGNTASGGWKIIFLLLIK